MKSAKDLKHVGSFGTVGIEIVLSILLGLWLGSKFDEWFHTKPWLTVVWFCFGCAAAGRSVYRSWKQMAAAAKREEAEEGNPEQAFPDDKSLKWKRQEEAEKRKAELEKESVGSGETSEVSPSEEEK
ncbi:MAG: AtpZ/AtpI family protein [Polyangiaceae bacterium]|nr:AtpZ/AtpI family protein [Polyangiaceae bacterium]